MIQTNGRTSSHSLDSSKLSNSTSIVPTNKQAKIMQARLLMDYYQNNTSLKQKKYQEQIKDKYSYGYHEQSLTQNYLMQQQAKKRRKQQIRQKLAQQYDSMIKLKEQKEKQQKKRVLQLQKKDLSLGKWGRDSKQDVIKKKRIQQQYGKQLEMHIRLQQIKKYQDRIKQHDMILKYKNQQAIQNNSYDIDQYKQHKRRQQFEKRQNEILGINKFNNPENNEQRQSLQLQRNDYRAMKRRQQMLYGSGLEHQLKSNGSVTLNSDRYRNPNQTQDSSSSRSNQRLYSSQNMYNQQAAYNPITNPIQIKYKNPNVLRMLAQYS